MNCIEWLPIYFGILKTGAMAVPLNFRYASDEIKYCLDLAEVDVLLFGPELKENIAELLNCLIDLFAYLNEISKYYEDKIIDVEYIFSLLDKTNKGYIEEEDFQNIFKYGDNGRCLPFEDLLLIMEKIDSNKDGKITCQDMIDLFKK